MQGLLLLYLRAASMPSKRKTENTPDYGRVRTELLSVSETSYKNERGSGHVNTLPLGTALTTFRLCCGQHACTHTNLCVEQLQI